MFDSHSAEYNLKMILSRGEVCEICQSSQTLKNFKAPVFDLTPGRGYSLEGLNHVLEEYKAVSATIGNIPITSAGATKMRWFISTGDASRDRVTF